MPNDTHRSHPSPLTASRPHRLQSRRPPDDMRPGTRLHPVLLLLVAALFHLVLSASDACNGCQVKAFVRVHEPVREGQSVTIDCFYDLAGGTLYSINWRFKGMEFLRLLRQFHVPSSSSSSSSSSFYVSPTSSSSSTSSSKSHQRSGDRQYTGRQKKPKTTKSPSSKPLPQMNMVFTPVQGIDIDETLSQNGSVVLRNVTISSLGEYSCEVTRDFPTFESVSGTQHLQFSSSSPVLKPYRDWRATLSRLCAPALLVHLLLLKL